MIQALWHGVFNSQKGIPPRANNGCYIDDDHHQIIIIAMVQKG
jgi:hypothetical protein